MKFGECERQQKLTYRKSMARKSKSSLFCVWICWNVVKLGEIHNPSLMDMLLTTNYPRFIQSVQCGMSLRTMLTQLDIGRRH